MAKYDNSKDWELYKELHLQKFAEEFRGKMDITIDEFLSSVKDMDFKAATGFINSSQTSSEPLQKIRTRFRTFSYKRRNKLTNLTISNDVKDKLESIMGKLGYEDYSSLLEELILTCNDYNIQKAAGLFDKVDRERDKK